MKCYICQISFGDPTDCPGICPKPKCNRAADDPATEVAFLAAKESHILAAMRQPGSTYVHLMSREE